MINYWMDVLLCGATVLLELFLVLMLVILIEYSLCLLFKESLLNKLFKKLKKLENKLNDYFEEEW